MANTLIVQHAHVLDPTASHWLEDHHVWVEDGSIREVSPQPFKVAPPDARVIDGRGKHLIPGLIDCHVHVTFSSMNLGWLAGIPQVTLTLKSLPIMRAMLRRGFTSVRDAGGATHALKMAVEDGMQGHVMGPRLFVSGAPLSPTGGHGDMRPRTDRLQPVGSCGHHRLGDIRIADGVDGVRLAVREQLQMGADQIKIMCSGGVASPTDPVNAFGYSLDEIRAIADEAAARHTYVLAHAYTAETITRAVQCGVRTIEHGNLVDEAAAQLMAEHGTFAVPTLVTYEALALEGTKLGLPPESVSKIAQVRDSGLRSLELFQRNGVRTAFGTDLLGDAHRLQSEEFRIRAQVQTPAQVLQSATLVAADVLEQTGKLGLIAAGALGDLLLVDGDPLTDITVLCGQGERINHVIKGGQICF